MTMAESISICARKQSWALHIATGILGTGPSKRNMGGEELKSATYRPGQPTKKKCPSAQCREAMEYVLRQQKSAPFPTRQWFHVLCISFRCKNAFCGHIKAKPIHPSTKIYLRGDTITSHPIVISKINPSKKLRNLHFKRIYANSFF